MGPAVAKRLAQEGARVVVASRRGEPLKRLADEIEGAWTTCDITDKEQVDRLVKFAKERYGHVDIGVNCSAQGVLMKFEEVPESVIDEMVAINYKGAFFFMQALVRAMDRGGSIIMFSTAAVRAIVENHVAYTAPKAAMENLVQAVAREFGCKGIRANAIAPGLTDTELASPMSTIPGVIEAFAREYPLGRIGTVQDVAAATAYLASDECFITGQTLDVNGGLTLRRNPTPAEIEASITAARSVASAASVREL